MNETWRIIYYETKEGECLIQSFIDNRKEREQAKIFSWFEQLEQEGPNLPRPYADFLINGIHELRVKCKGKQARILYFFCYKEFIILTHGFIKTTDKVDNSEIKKSIKFRKDFLERFKDKKSVEELINENI